MSLRPATRLLAAVLPCVLLLPAAAHAEKVVTEDAAGDSLQYAFGLESEQDPDPVPAPEDTSVDVTKTVVAHGPRRLSITVHITDLQRRDFFSAFTKVLTPRGGYAIDIGYEKGSRPTPSLEQGSGRDVECRGLRGSIDAASDLVSLSVPTSCIGEPRWVQVGVGVLAFDVPADPDATSYVIVADDAHRDGTINMNSIAKGSRVHRG